tara:strand:+ start:610 stop:1632 length:1023 start_codon:yes stop_codon:yes gene_type:complete
MSLDKTLRDINRRPVSVLDKKQISGVLPEYFQTEYPKFGRFLEAYYDYMDGDTSPAKLIDELFLSRDITQVDIDLLSFIEDELLLGQQFFEGFKNKREAADYSSTLYKSKGTKYSIEQFFRVFFNSFVDVEYTKENIFIVGNVHDLKKEKENHNAGITPYAPEITVSASRIGPDEQRFLTDDKLYQKYALLIKSTLPIDTWRDIYKLFVHPAGMYVAGEVQIVGVAEKDYLAMPDGIADSAGPIFAGVADVAILQFNATNHIVQQILPTQQTFTLAPIQLGQFQGGNMTLAEFDRNFDTLAEGTNAGSQTFDEDSVVGDSSYPRMSSNNQLLINFSNDFF